jgi:hypothetical protein
MGGWAIKRGTREVAIPDEATLRKWADEGRFNPGDLIFHPTLQRWLYAQDVLEIRGVFQETDGATTPSPAASSSQKTQSQPTEMPSKEFIVRLAGRDFRAPDIATVRVWALEGRIHYDSYVFHPMLNRWAYARDLAVLEGLFKAATTNISSLALSYRRLVLWVGVQLVVSITLILFSSLSVILVPALLATIIALALYAFRTAEAIGSSTAPLWSIAMLIPCVNGITLLVLSSKATAVCRANGVPVGFLGPRL